MRLGNYLSSLTKPELEELKEVLNLTEEEYVIYNLLAKGYSNTYVANTCCVAISTIANRNRDIKSKINKIKGEIF